jgi:hypothetical protein
MVERMEGLALVFHQAAGGGHVWDSIIMIRYRIFALAWLAWTAGTALAGEIEDLARDAEAKANAGQHIEAVEALRRAINLLTAKGPLTLRRVQFISEPPQGFGIYQPRANNVFQAGEPLIVYAEPVGMGWSAAAGVNRAHVTADFEIRTTDGKILGGQKNFGGFEFTSRDQNHEIMTHLTIRLSGIQPGRYVFAATYRDQVSGKSANMELPFEIR